MDEQKKKKRVRLPLRAYLLYLLLVTFALTGVTFSRYVVSSDWGDGARVASIRQLTVTETGDVPAEGGKWLLAPGLRIDIHAAAVQYPGTDGIARAQAAWDAVRTAS